MEALQQKIIIIDGNSLLHRAYHGMRPLTNRDGEYTHGVYGFLRMLESLLREEQPAATAVAFDVGKTFRHDLYPDYKAGRKETDAELKSQFPLLKEALRALGIPVLEAPGYEADDILGTVARLGTEAGDQVILVTGDKDAFQLINGNTRLYLTRKGLSDIEKLDGETLLEKYGFTPAQAPDVKGLQGDPSDNIKGVFGIGAKGALNLIQAYGSLEGIYSHLEELKGKLKENLIAGRDSAFFSRKLGTIARDVPMDYEELKAGVRDREALEKLFQRLEFRNVFQDHLKTEGEEADRQQEAAGWIIPEAFDKAQPFLQRLADAGPHLDLVPEIRGGDLSGLQAFDGTLAASYSPAFPTIGETREILTWLRDSGRTLGAFDSKGLYRLFLDNGSEYLGAVEDASLLSYVLYPERKHQPESIIRDLLGMQPEPAYMAQCLARATSLLLEKSREEGVYEVYEKIEKPLAPILAAMEARGVGLDRQYLVTMELEMAGQIQKLKEQIWAAAGSEFNVNSTQQLGQILFETLGLPSGKKTKTGYSTSQEILEKLYDQHKIIPLILDYRRLTKLYSTYLEGLLAAGEEGVVHTTYNQTVAVTGRLSSENPNLQNIPIRTPEGRMIRRAFKPVEEGNLLLCADYSQIELRILAHITGDSGLQDAFRKGEDIHRRTAGEVFGVPPEAVTPEQRRAAKAVNFGIVYGISDFGLSRDLGISMAEAREYISRYFQRYPKVREWIDTTLAEARKTLKVYTLTGRFRSLPELKSSQYMVRSGAERMAMNAPIQGTAADLIKLAMIRVDRELKEKGIRARLILQVHDELILEVPPAEMEQVRELVKGEMKEAMELVVPLEVDVKAGANWYDVEEA